MSTDYQKQKLKEITDKLEQGIKELFDSDNFKTYLNTMAKFHNYSFNNTLLIALQKPDATLVAGYRAWEKNFSRHVLKGETGIKIIAPTPYKEKIEVNKLDPETQLPVLDENGDIVTETKEYIKPCFRVVSVFDVSQTDGKELPEFVVKELEGSVENYTAFFNALIQTSPVPITFENIEGGAKGYFSSSEKRIVINEGMSETQTLKTTIHEIAHAILHNYDSKNAVPFSERKDRHTKEVEAESVAYTVCQHYGIDTSDYSFGYVAGWSSGKDMVELKSSLDTIHATASQIFTSVDNFMLELQSENEIINKVIPVQGINDYSNIEIENTVCNYAQELINDCGMTDIKIIGAKVYGSRAKNLATDDSDLDVVLEYKGNIREDDFFNLLNDENLIIEGIKVDINPITECNSGTLCSYLENANNYYEQTDDCFPMTM